MCRHGRLLCVGRLGAAQGLGDSCPRWSGPRSFFPSPRFASSPFPSFSRSSTRFFFFRASSSFPLRSSAFRSLLITCLPGSEFVFVVTQRKGNQCARGAGWGSFRSGCSMRRTTSVAPRRTPPEAPPSLWVHSKWSRAGKAGALGSSPHSRGGPKYKVINMKSPEEAAGSPYLLCKPYGQLPCRSHAGERVWANACGGSSWEEG
jgi:hypothetical protein